MNVLDTSDTVTEDLIRVREILNEDNEPDGSGVVTIPGCAVVARLPQFDQYTTGERTVSTLDVRHADRDLDVRASDRFRRPGDLSTGRARWTVEGDPARSPWSDGGIVFVLQREVG